MDLFTYGTLMSPDIMARVAGCRLTALPATLPGYRRSQVKDEVYPGISEEAAEQVTGVLYLSVPAAALQRLDVFEGEMYERRQVLVVDEGEVVRAAMTYVFRPAYLHLLTDIPWDFAQFLVSGKKCFEEGYFGFDEIEAP
jgi:gamma-glutamylcyclotransferase (GGCT)/AIG2-like uncharacterized protein YtfP